jgi:hypothetical protein
VIETTLCDLTGNSGKTDRFILLLIDVVIDGALIFVGE